MPEKTWGLSQTAGAVNPQSLRTRRRLYLAPNSMNVTPTIFLFILISTLGQLLMTAFFTREALTTQASTYCRIKCSLAALFYLLFSIMLSWFLFSSEIDRCPE